MRIELPLLLCLLPLAATAQQEPLTAIDWLGRNSPQVRTGPVLSEPPVTQTALRPSVEVETLETLPEPVGLVPSSVTGLPETLWRGSDARRLADLIARVPVADFPAMQTLLYTLLLTEARPPQGAADAETLLLARLDRLLELGAADPAQSLAEAAGPRQSPAVFRRWFDATLLTGDEDASCAALRAEPWLLDDYAARVFCAVRGGDWQTAALTVEAVHALGLEPQDRLDLLDRFLSPDIFEGAPPLPVPAVADPLTFRLYETIGERLPTTPLPRAFATADLRDIAGWKAQVEAAERLTRIGALSPNRLLGLFTERQPAASGGVWDRIAALQRFETAIDQNSPEAVSKTLPPVWSAMRTARLEVPFAELFADRLARITLTDPDARALAWRVMLLSPAYETAASSPAGASASDAFLAALAKGQPGSVAAPSTRAQAIADGFAEGAAPPPRIREALGEGRLGEGILMAMLLFDRGAHGNATDLSAALATFRSLGLEDIARRAALQLMILGRRA